MVLLGWSQREVYSDRLYDHVKFSGETNLIHVLDSSGVQHIGVEVRYKGKVKESDIEKSHRYLMKNVFGVLEGMEPKLFILSEVL
ncbi:hypothetical protein Aci011_103 [Acinetobacter phage vB_AbaM_B09_Aci01-1]|uniref:Uncharacterized protein n=3 Tax=Saclayvirus TaxID=2733128 RepID=A0A386KL65_9CAUD|nr:hypothetical protein HOU29_gp078 [Acinetobacter phage vB_AbaM_B09_Aci01-1]YP_009813326.1 hypothetical protein HOU30_gp086 [Acinetobacter phage vB_AbaM_B09_Aci02-2]YP_009813956.1 hypothetical protein HOU35_gp075 [Acinetobacter phage vB_AbaM_B09_Aci05]AZF88502.1 hypothetical protein TAC_0114 [Acinetobacter phage TAC1]QMP19060.1 hypothetical protein FKOIJHOC_00112 [Acinetobacter phage Ab_121]QQV88802.1 hypothetical protein Liucustia_102 [Acinetobacter phage Liucustia]UYL86245.1 hypothetical p